MRKSALLCLLAFFLTASAAHAAIFSQVHGVVHDPQHRPIAGAHIDIHAAQAANMRRPVGWVHRSSIYCGLVM